MTKAAQDGRLDLAGKNIMSDLIPPTREALSEALALSGEILRNIELSEIPLTNVALKASRLAGLLNDFDYQRIMEYEASGYPTHPDGVPSKTWRLAELAGRKFNMRDPETKKLSEYVYVTSIAELEHQLRLAETSLAAARDADVGVSSANPYQPVWTPRGNVVERITIRESLTVASKRLASSRAMIHQYTFRKHYELKFSGIADDVFARIRERVDARIGQLIPDAVQRFAAVYGNLRSENPEDWSNAVHSCRGILRALADAVFPATDEERLVTVEGEQRTVKLGSEHYINRIMAFVQDSCDSRRFREIVGSHLSFLGDRLDSVVRAAQKGSHHTIVSREEAERYVVYTYMVVGDMLSLRPE